MPVASFAPEFIEFYRRASQKKIIVKIKKAAEAHKFRARLHSLRRCMREEHHPMAPIANCVTVSLKEQSDGSAIITAYPSDQQYIAYLLSVGITIEEPDAISTTLANGELKTPEDEKVDNQLGDFFRGENKS